MRRYLSILAIAGTLCLAAAPAGAQPVSPMELIADRPAATLLLPYFEVDLADAQGSNTVFSVNNSSATAALAHVTLWSDLSVPVLAFNVYLTGYDVQYIDLRKVLTGQLPVTASDGQDLGDSGDPADGISNQGALSQDINFANCSGQLPPPPLDAAYATHMRRALTGRSSVFFGNLCSGLDHGDRMARGYVTVDTVNNCTLEPPSSPGYVTSLTFQNILWGEFFYLTPRLAANGATYSEGGALVGVQADLTDPEVGVPGEYTFYGRYNAWTAADRRQPLATTFGARYFSRAPFSSKTQLVAWRDPKVNQGAFACGTLPGWYPLTQTQMVVFDEFENPNVTPVPPVFPPPPGPFAMPFPAAAQRVKIGTSSLPVPFPSGWIYFNLSTFVVQAGANPPEDPAAAQAWVYVIQDPKGRFNLGYPAMQYDSAAEATTQIIPVF